MKIVKPSHMIMSITPEFDGKDILLHIEACGRTAYQSLSHMCTGSAERFCKMLIDRGHESVLEHASLTVRFVTDRAIANELVRHRIASYTQESTRYVRYDDLQVVLPGDDVSRYMVDTLADIECAYKEMLLDGVPPQTARAILPLCLKTEIVATQNIRTWRHVLRTRTAIDAHPDMRRLMVPLLRDLQAAIPVLFDDIQAEEVD